MPHLIIEYAQDMGVDDKVPAMLDAIHNAAVATGLFDEGNIKVRAIPLVHYRFGKGQDPFMHAQLRIQMGRNQDQKKALSHAVLNALRQQHWPAKMITVEVVEMDTLTYAKYSANVE